jgi:segregation and condensation protein B
MKAVLEGLLFVVGDEGLTEEQISNILELDKEETKKIIEDLKNDYEKEDRGLKIGYLGNTLKLTTKREHKEYYKKLLEESDNALSDVALEVLAIIAYNAPVTRMQVEDLRGICSVYIIKKLEAKGFIKETGRADTIGKPILYNITDEFLDYFGLKSIDELPNVEEEKEEDSETDLFMARYKE